MTNGIGSVGGQLDGVVVGKLDLSHGVDVGVVVENRCSFDNKQSFCMISGSVIISG